MRAAGGCVRRDTEVIECRALNPLVVVMRNADEYADIAPLFQIQNYPCVFDRLPSRFKEQPMLRIYVRSFPRRDTKELGIELVDLVQEPRPFGESFSGDARLGIVIPLHIPPVGRHLGDRVPMLSQQLPKGLGIVHRAWKAASDSYDSNAVFVHKGTGSGELRPDDRTTYIYGNQRDECFL